MEPLGLSSDVIAERQLYILGEDPAREIIVRLGRPQRKTNNPNDYFCPYVILGLGAQVVRGASGVDAFQAIQLTLKQIAYELTIRNAGLDGRLRWLGDDEVDIGFRVEDSM